MTQVRISGDPTDEEVAAIVAAVQVATARPGGAPDRHPEAPRWRWSGRWWSRPIPQRRVRPW